jgi:hypothetical protein
MVAVDKEGKPTIVLALRLKKPPCSAYVGQGVALRKKLRKQAGRRSSTAEEHIQ